MTAQARQVWRGGKAHPMARETKAQRDELLDLIRFALDNPKATEHNSGFISEARVAIARAEKGGAQ